MKILFIFSLLTGFVSDSFCQNQGSADSLSAQQSVVRLFDGIAEIDSAKIVANVTKDFLLLEDGLVWNMDSLVKAIKPMKNPGF